MSRGATVKSDASVAFTDLAALLARAYLRLGETSRNGAVSSPVDEHVSLDVPALPRPDVTAVRDGRRAE
jgi:hypothetical protein